MRNRIGVQYKHRIQHLQHNSWDEICYQRYRWIQWGDYCNWPIGREHGDSYAVPHHRRFCITDHDLDLLWHASDVDASFVPRIINGSAMKPPSGGFLFFISVGCS